MSKTCPWILMAAAFTGPWQQGASSQHVVSTVEPAAIEPAAGTPQIVNVGQPSAELLQALVTDASRKPLPGRMVTFTAPSKGPGGTFARKGPTATVLTDSSGVATAPAFITNATPGNYVATATVPGVASAARFALTNAIPGPPSLGGTIRGKSGPANARAWIFEVGNKGPGSALHAEITSVTLTQTSGTPCSPVIRTPLPLAVGNIAPQESGEVSVTIDFTNCASTAVFKVTAAESSNNHTATGTFLRLNQFQ